MALKKCMKYLKIMRSKTEGLLMINSYAGIPTIKKEGYLFILETPGFNVRIL
jgi:hypothetical protein